MQSLRKIKGIKNFLILILLHIHLIKMHMHIQDRNVQHNQHYLFIKIGLKLDLFKTLSRGPQSLSVLATQFGMTREAAERLLTAAQSLKLVEKRGLDAHGEQRYGLGRLGAPLVDNEAVLAMVEHHAVLYADLADPLRADGRHLAANLHQCLRAEAAQRRHGHAVDVAARRERAGVEVGMGVQPQHAQLLAGVAAVAGHRADRA